MFLSFLESTLIFVKLRTPRLAQKLSRKFVWPTARRLLSLSFIPTKRLLSFRWETASGELSHVAAGRKTMSRLDSSLCRVAAWSALPVVTGGCSPRLSGALVLARGFRPARITRFIFEVGCLLPPAGWHWRHHASSRTEAHALRLRSRCERRPN